MQRKRVDPLMVLCGCVYVPTALCSHSFCSKSYLTNLSPTISTCTCRVVGRYSCGNYTAVGTWGCGTIQVWEHRAVGTEQLWELYSGGT